MFDLFRNVDFLLTSGRPEMWLMYK